MATLVAICDYDAGFDLGTWVGNNLKSGDGSPLRILDVGLPWLRLCLLRSEGFVDGVRSIQPDAVVVASINGEATPSVAQKIAEETLAEKGDVDVIFAMDDETAQGRYEVPALPTGVYTVEGTASGFQATSVKDLRLAVGEKARADVIMTVGGVDAVVTVVNQTRTDTETSAIGDTIASERITDNPVNGRDFTSLLATVPGSVQTTNQFQTSINGIPSTFGGSSVLVDGIDAGRVDLNGTSNVLGRIESRVNRVSMDSIQEVQVVEHTYSAQYGQAIGAVINPITKSGGNEFHGSIFEFLRNEALDSEDFLPENKSFV